MPTNQNNVTETKFLVSDLSGQPDFVKKQREKDFWGRPSLHYLNVSNTEKDITLSALVHNSAFCIEYFTIVINNVSKYHKVWGNKRGYTK